MPLRIDNERILVTLYIPDSHFNDNLIKPLALVAGGCTIVRGRGLWMDGATLYDEQVHVVSVWVTKEVLSKLDVPLGNIVAHLILHGEKAVMWCLQVGEMHLET